MARSIALSALLGTCAFCMVSAASAFEANGLLSGMSRQDAEAVLLREGHRLFPNQRDPDLLVASSREGRTVTLKFCGDRLAQHSYTIPGGKAAYLRELEAFTRVRGKGRAENSSRRSGSPIESEGIAWTVGSDYLKLSYVYPSSDHQESVSMTYIDPSICK